MEQPPVPQPAAVVEIPQQQQQQQAAAAAAEADHGLGPGILDGGIIGPNPDQKRTLDADLLFTLHCSNDLLLPQPDKSNDNKSCSGSSNIKITFGMDKSSKLDTLYAAFVEYMNTKFPEQLACKSACTGKFQQPLQLQICHIEMVHMDVLQYSTVANCTADQCALMKGDTIVVRRNRTKERMAAKQLELLQKECDLVFYRQLRGILMPDSHSPLGGAGADNNHISGADIDVVLDCQQRLTDGQEVLSTLVKVKAHSYILAKRCPYLWNLVLKEKKAKLLQEEGEQDHEQQEKQVFTIEQDQDDGNNNNNEDEEPRSEESSSSSVTSTLMTAKVEDDDEDGPKLSSRSKATGSHSRIRPVFTSSHTSKNMLLVPMKQYPPETVKLLLEFCYTNRCITCGQEAFEVSCPGAVSPYPGKGWPIFGHPLISMSVALAGIALGEEADMPKFSLMCEIAASHLISNKNILEVLSLCSTQALKTGNRLSTLRNRAAAYLLRPHVLDELSRDKPFMSNLNKKREHVVPALLHGTRESISNFKQQKRNTSGNNESGNNSYRVMFYHFFSQDADDRMNRALERAKWRSGRNQGKKRKLDLADLTECNTLHSHL